MMETAAANLERFRAIVRSDYTLAAKLREVNDRALFASEVVRLAGELGLALDCAAVEDALRLETHYWLIRWLD